MASSIPLGNTKLIATGSTAEIYARGNGHAPKLFLSSESRQLYENEKLLQGPLTRLVSRFRK